MKGADLIRVADGLGIKVACNKARTALKESKQAVIDRIIAKENEQNKSEQKPEEVVHVEVTDLPAVREEPKNVKEEKKEAKQRKGRKLEKKTLEELVADLPIISNIQFKPAAHGGIVIKRGNKRIFRYTGSRMIATCEARFAGCEYKSVGGAYVIENPTTDIIKRVFCNV
jgi:hypothetical protein